MRQRTRMKRVGDHPSAIRTNRTEPMATRLRLVANTKTVCVSCAIQLNRVVQGQ